MTVPSGVLKHKYQGDGSNDQFDYDFKITSKNYVLVQKQVGTADPVDLTVDIDFSITGIGSDSGGVITYPLVGTKLAAQEFLIIKPAYPYNQNLQLNALTLPPKEVEGQFDILSMQIKQVADELSRALQVSEAYDGDVDTFISLITSTSSALIATISGTSTSTLSVGTGSKTFTTQSGKSWVLGQRLRAASDDGTKIMEGQVTSYSSTTLILDIDYTSGSGSHSDWNISLTGARGASGAGSGDMLASNNLSDVANAATSFTNIKQLATTSTTGVARQATNAEALAGLLDNVIVSPTALEYVLQNSSHTTKYYDLIKTIDVSSGTGYITFVNGVDGVVIDNTYRKYVLEFSGLYTNGGKIDPQILLGYGSTPTWLSGSTSSIYYQSGKGRNSSGTDLNYSSNVLTTFMPKTAFEVPTSEEISGYIEFYRPSSNGRTIMHAYVTGQQDTSTKSAWIDSTAIIDNTSAALGVTTGFRLSTTSTLFDGGKLKLYGVR